jgi:hypothetical protein
MTENQTSPTSHHKTATSITEIPQKLNVISPSDIPLSVIKTYKSKFACVKRLFLSFFVISLPKTVVKRRPNPNGLKQKMKIHSLFIETKPNEVKRKIVTSQ